MGFCRCKGAINAIDIVNSYIDIVPNVAYNQDTGHKLLVYWSCKPYGLQDLFVLMRIIL